MVRRVAAFGLLLLTAALLQTTLFARYLTLFGTTPDLILVVVICFALVEGPMVAASTGFAGGLLRDLLLVAPKGLTSLAYIIVGYLVGTVRPYVQSTGVMVPVLGIFSGSVIGNVIYLTLLALLGEALAPAARLVQLILLGSLYNTLLTPFVYPVVRRVAVSVKPEKVYRW